MDFFMQHDTRSVVVVFVPESEFTDWKKTLTDSQQSWLDISGFSAKARQVCSLLDNSGQLEKVVCSLPKPDALFDWCNQVAQFPKGIFHLSRHHSINDKHWFNLHLYWGLSQYQFTRYKKQSITEKFLCYPVDIEKDELISSVDALTLAKDIINTPNEDMHPQALAHTVSVVAEKFNAKVKVIEGDALLSEGFPTIHRVGRAGHRAPCFIEMTWGDETHPKVTLVGKGVCFDTGGINIKNTTGMRHMKKDMGGAACALALGELIMASKLPVSLSLLIPAVENNIAANCMVPGDVVITRSGLSVEISNTDAEGRLILCDALSYAAESSPALLIDFATLTGAARVALGPDCVPFFSNCSELAQGLGSAASNIGLTYWQMPLYEPYLEYLKSDVADCMNAGETYFAGAITAALYLQQFVSDDLRWAHFDIFAWNAASKPGRPRGGEAECVLGVFEYLKSIY